MVIMEIVSRGDNIFWGVRQREMNKDISCARSVVCKETWKNSAQLLDPWEP